MKPVFQTILESGRGDCFCAALASLLELPLDCVPNFRALDTEENDMMELARSWLLRYFGLSLLTIQMQNEDYEGLENLPIIGAARKTPCIAGGVSPNTENGFHAIVGEIDELGNFTMTHDPNPSGKGIAGRPLHLYFLVRMNPAISKINRLSTYQPESLPIDKWFQESFEKLKNQL